MFKRRRTGTYTQEMGSLKRSFSDEEKLDSLEARDAPERRPERNGDRGLKTVEIGLTGQGGESSE
jgi:hypothetical protein